MMRNGRIAAAIDRTDAGVQRQPSGLLPPLGKRKRVMSMQYLIGVFYQIRDDYINICSEKYAKEKCFFEDITEGKVWMTVIENYSSPIQSFVVFIRIPRTID